MSLSRQKIIRNSDPLLEASPEVDRTPLNEETFQRMIAVERKRTERSKAPFLLMLVEIEEGGAIQEKVRTLASVTEALLASSRDTDLIGWYRTGVTLGAIYTGLPDGDKRSILDTFLIKVNKALVEELTEEQISRIKISFHMFPDDWDHDKPGRPSNEALYPDLASKNKGKRVMLMTKRIVDIVGSSLMLAILSPLFLVIALTIKLTSKGPVLFRQQRVGHFGKTFTFLKFRSMYADNDPRVHQEFVRRLIANQSEGKGEGTVAQPVYKITNDRRITKVGSFLRRTSLDELPQFLNVLSGSMSLVGPRPPIPYELASYQTWHRRRLLAVKPGITGLWQVLGRSTVEFDEMVRLDLRYATTWTPWLDLKILLRTPLAVIRGSGAY